MFPVNFIIITIIIINNMLTQQRWPLFYQDWLSFLSNINIQHQHKSSVTLRISYGIVALTASWNIMATSCVQLRCQVKGEMELQNTSWKHHVWLDTLYHNQSIILYISDLYLFLLHSRATARVRPVDLQV